MRITVSRCVVVFGVALGCSRTYVRPEVPRAQPADVAKRETLLPGTAGTIAAAEPREGECQVRVEIYNATKTITTGPLCIKRKDQSFRIPFPIYLIGKEDRAENQFGGMCLDDVSKEVPAQQALGVATGAATAPAPQTEARTCAWTGLFRDAFPFTFKIYTEGNKVALGEYARTIRVFRNGKLVYSWKNEDSFTEVLIPGSSLTTRLLPFGAPIDLRIIPTTSPDDPRIVTAVEQSIDPLRTRIAIAKTVVVGLAEPTVAPAVKCLQWLVSKAQSTAQSILGHRVSPPGLPPERCEAPTDGDAAALHQRLKKAVQGGAATADQILETEIEKLGAAYGERIREEATKAKAALVKKAADAELSNGHTVADTIVQIDALASAGAQVFDYLERSIRTGLADVKRFAKDRDAQARELAALTEALELQGSVFDPYTKNPELVEGETALDMRYGDRLQGFLLAPWHGVPFRVTRNPGASIDLATAIPILDLGGFRYQWGTGRATSFRAGAGIMYFKDEDMAMTAGGTMASTSVFNVAAQANVSWTGFMLGFGYVLNNRAYDGRADADRIRVLVGADLLKVFGNRNAEAF